MKGRSITGVNKVRLGNEKDLITVLTTSVLTEYREMRGQNKPGSYEKCSNDDGQN